MATNLISVQLTFTLFLFSLLLERQDNQSHKNVEEEEGEDDDKENIVQRDLYLVIHHRTVVNIRCINGSLHETVARSGTINRLLEKRELKQSLL